MKFFIVAFTLTLALCAFSYANWAAQTLDQLTVEQKIGQLFMVATQSNYSSGINDVPFERSPYRIEQSYIESLIHDYHIGGLIFLGLSTAEQHVAATNHYQKLSAIPLLIGMDFEWGLSMRLKDAIKYPRNGALSSVSHHQLIYDLAREIGRQMKAIGAHINFAPVVDVNTNPLNPIIKDRSFGADRELVAELGTLMMLGLQDAGIIACAKHFPGHGDTTIDSHHDLPMLSHTRERLNEIELYPFKTLIDAGVRSVMVGHLEIPALEPTPHLPASLSAAVIRDLLKSELCFKGLVITDGLGMQGVMKYHKPGELECKALLAGNDILLCPVDVPRAVELIKLAIADGTLSMADLDAHVLKILQTKESVGLNIWNPIVYDRNELHTDYAYALKAKLETAITNN